MRRDINALRDQAAERTLERIRADVERVCEALKPALEVIEKRLFDPTLDVNAIWRESGLSKESSALFSAQVGETPKDYVTGRRFDVAAQLLAGTDLKIGQIAAALGYSVTSDTFFKMVQRRTGMSPTAFRVAAACGHGGAGGEARKSLSSWVEQVGRASEAGDFEGAYRGLSRAEAALRDRQIQDLATQLGLACHERGAHRTRDGDVDRAYGDLGLACRCYALAGDLPPALRRRRRHVPVSSVTDEALYSALCEDCRTTLAGDEGRAVRHHLRAALRLVPRDLEWFEVCCCDDCYRVVWSAVSRARAGLMDDAWQAWWLSLNADLEDRETPPSRGRVIAALAEVERLVTGDQLERMGYCDLAVADAAAIGEPLLEVQARIWRAGVLRAMGQLADAREELVATSEASRATTWLTALHVRMAGILENDSNHRQRALSLLRSATSFYKTLDPHVSGLFLIQQGSVHFYLAEYEKPVALYQEALNFLDSRRDPMPAEGVVPIHSAACFALLGDWDKAESAFSKCRYQRDDHPGLAATEAFYRACFDLLRGRTNASVGHFAEVKEGFERHHRPLDIALAASYSVEAYARLGDRAAAIENVLSALSFFQAAGCTQDTLDAVARLRVLLEADVIDVTAVSAGARSLAQRHGGWLPATA